MCTIRAGGTRNASAPFITLSKFERQFNGDRVLRSTLLTALVDCNFNGPMSNSEQTCEQY